MRAVVFRSSDKPVEVEQVTLQGPGPHEVEVKIAAAGVCHSDLHVRRGDWDLPLPLVMGHEGSGIVTAVGKGVSHLREGDHVVLSWVAPCGNCRNCLLGREIRCEVAATTVALGGTLNDGTSRLSQGQDPVHHYLGTSAFAERAVVPASGALKIRKDAPLEQMSLVGCAVATGVGAVRNSAQVPPGATVAVIGCGGVGLSVIQGARMAQAERIVAVDIQDDKTDLATTFGATDTITATPDLDVPDALRSILPDGVDYAFDAIGHQRTSEQAIAMLAIGGCAVIVGIPPAGTRISIEPQHLVDLDQRVIGSNYGGIRPSRDIPWLVKEYMEERLLVDQLVSARRPLEEAEQSLHDLSNGSALRQLLVPQM
ncbi:Zn-dependent alcohol dehydrogenase [Brevibacterium aurantiacum]|uniref:Zn-dependent alcohol dehydrogenase n=1 Tax=Brevibacterium aurantiacum TaxID=273384 RepID=A0A556CCD2_BREAU|nr:Zn-dependent alcohol dehydrogenase [Brevibacterium aurantiacum]TSI15102.1 Zn-dependent alcohol dehydrogenase [Brevibacterium aurantiacum]